MKPYLKFFVFILLTGLLFYTSCKKELPCENCKDRNKPPIANAGANQIIILPKDSATLDGTASTDPDGTIVSYKWIKISGPLSFNILKKDSSKTLVKTLVMGVYKFELTVTDNGGLSAKDTVQIIVNDPAHNQPPIANSGSDQTITLPTDSVLLKGNLSFDPDGTITSYKWIKISGPVSSTILNPDSSKTLVKTLVQGIYKFELTVKDNGGLTAKDTIQVMVDNPAVNQPPIACAGADQVITLPTNSVNLNGSCSSDPENNITGYAWRKISGPSSFSITNSNAVQTQVTNLVEGTYQFELNVTDASGLFSRDTVSVTVNALAVDHLIANAGADMIITLPLDSAFINGYYSDATIPGYEWTLISGPSLCTISNSHAPSTLVKYLIPGTYSFQLKGNSNGLLFADTMNVTVLDDPQERNTITYKNLEWTMSDIYGIGTQSLSLPKPDWFDLADRPIEVYLQLDSASQWLIVLPIPGDSNHYVYECAFHCLYRFWIFGASWAGRKSSIKVKIW